MTRPLIQIVLNAVALLVIAELIPGISWQGGPLYLLLAGLVLGLVNLVVKPITVLLSLPFIVVTLGLFFLVINGAMLWLAAALLDGLSIDGCGSAILGGFVLALFNWIVRSFEKSDG